MSFRPETGEKLNIDGTIYQVAEHPAAPGMPYGQEGRQATVYQLRSASGPRALKVFKPLYRRVSDQVRLTQALAAHSQVPGLSVCQRTVLNASQHDALVAQYPDLEGSVLMPWIVGPTWMLIVLQDRELTPEWSLYLASSFANVLAALEERGVAHCDLSGPNVLIPAFANGKEQGNSNPKAYMPATQSPVEVVDVEQMYGPGLTRPQTVPAGSAGYAQRTSSTGIWSKHGDRFAGALLVAEMLGWCDPQVRATVWGEGFFDPKEMQDPGSNRYKKLLGALRNRWGEPVADLFSRAWQSHSLSDCPKLSEWALAIPNRIRAVSTTTPARDVSQNTVASSASFGVQRNTRTMPVKGESAVALTLEALARSLEQSGRLTSALQYYRDALSLAAAGTNLHTELVQEIKSLEIRSPGLQASPPAFAVDGLASAPLRTVSSTSSKSVVPTSWTLVTVPPNGPSPQTVASAQSSPVGPPSGAPPPAKAKPGTVGAGSYNAGTKAPSYSMPPGIASLTSDPAHSSAPVPFVPSNSASISVYKVPASSPSASSYKWGNMAGWAVLVLMILAAIFLAWIGPIR